jgi:hypothetical protein
MMFTFWNYNVLKLLRLETITFSNAMLSDINVVLCYVLSQYRFNLIPTVLEIRNPALIRRPDFGLKIPSYQQNFLSLFRTIFSTFY